MIKVMAQLILAYLIAAALAVTVVYLARQNRKQGWQRPAPVWFGVALGTREAAKPAAFGTGSDSGDLMTELLHLNRELAAHGSPVKPEGEATETPEFVTVGTRENVSTRRV